MKTQRDKDRADIIVPTKAFQASGGEIKSIPAWMSKAFIVSGGERARLNSRANKAATFRGDK